MPARFELPARTASGVVMGTAAVAAVVGGEFLFSVVVATIAVAALREWHRLVNGGRWAREMIATSLGVVAMVLLVRSEMGIGLGLATIAAGAVGAAAISAQRRPAEYWPIPWHAFGSAYIGLPALALVLLRNEPRGAALMGGLFVAVWTADTGALFFGRLIGGPKLAPDLSPNKTWAGFLGGTAAAGIAEGIYIGLLGGAALSAVLFGVFLALAGHCGDLFESWVKRQFHAKNTGSLIPGHGGMLDRIDSLLFAAPACATFVFQTGFNPLAAS
jgi:phosphatidate cytidylyltransferase